MGSTSSPPDELSSGPSPVLDTSEEELDVSDPLLLPVGGSFVAVVPTDGSPVDVPSSVAFPVGSTSDEAVHAPPKAAKIESERRSRPRLT